MKYKRITAFLLLLLFCCNIIHLNAQTTSFSTYKIPNVGTISIPDNMELSGGQYRKMANKNIREVYGGNIENRIVFQQSGLNDFKQSSFSSYVRVIIETDIESFGTFEKANAKIDVSNFELNQISRQLKEQLESSFENNNMRLIKWMGIKMVKINGLNALKVSYIRQVGDNPYATVNMYQFQNNDRVHRLTLSYRNTEENIWKPLLEKVAESFKIAYIR